MYLAPVVENGEVTNALGVFLRGEGDDMVFEYSRGNVGFRCLYNTYADRRGGFSIMTNSDQGGLFCDAMRDVLLKFYGDENEAEKIADLEIDFKPILGDYKHQDLQASIRQDGEALVLQWNKQEPLKIKPKSNDQFSISGLESTIKIERNAERHVTALSFNKSGTSKKLERV